MAVMPILKFGNPTLKLPSRTVQPNEEGLDTLIKNMTDTMYDAPGVGLAAVQIGVLKKVVTYDIGEGLNILLNPEIVSFEDEEEEEEGCLSVPEARIQIKRYLSIEVKGINEHGEPRHFEAEGFAARALQHEIDHINGVLILDRASREERKKVLKELNHMTGIT